MTTTQAIELAVGIFIIATVVAILTYKVRDRATTTPQLEVGNMRSQYELRITIVYNKERPNDGESVIVIFHDDLYRAKYERVNGDEWFTHEVYGSIPFAHAYGWYRENKI